MTITPLPPTDWNTRLAVTYTDPDGTDHQITPITSFTPTFGTTAEPLHSIERTHVGVVFSPQQLTFSMTVPAVGDAAGKLTAIALQGQRFKVTLQEQIGNDWSFSTIVMDQCVITSASPSPATVSGVPSATFSGFSNHVESTDSSSQKTTAPPQS
ncbi:MAG TPA: hypothetical protein VHW64_13670 [Nocardioides sp.]|jgi:hypothetical protein|uniref:hypothetical protein n=1 Tax=Nocardioides sp. TaxID=35761 RepID=UPI002E34CF97|nr:hypothetical protein [Nocardioides sp.]HEX3931749.1 hypothetical protein [Nocardioides sp.]